MSYLGDSLADGQLTTTLADLYTVPDGYSALITAITLANSSGFDRQATLYVQRSGGTARLLGTIDLEETGLDESGKALSIPLPLSSGDKLQAEADTDNDIDYVICGALRKTG